jgi:hypothetical protein
MKYRFPILILFFLTGSLCAQQSGPKPVGKIVRVEGRAYLLQGQTRKVLPSGNLNIPLFAENEIGCISTCKIRFEIGSEPLIKSSRFVIPNQIRRRSSEKNFVVTAGNKGGANIILFPIASEVGMVRPESFRFRWRVVRLNGNVVDIRPLTLSLNTCEVIDELWHQAGIDYQSGSYSNEDAIRELKNRQSKDANSRIEIVLESESFKKKERFCFSLISKTEEERLQRELATWNEYADFIRLTERARIFEEHKLYQDAILEYEEALKLFPNTDHLLAEAIRAYLRIGDRDKAIELRNRLRQISPGNREYLRVKEIMRRAQ